MKSEAVAAYIKKCKIQKVNIYTPNRAIETVIILNY